MDAVKNIVYKELDISEQQIKNGQVMDAQEHLENLKFKYGLSERPYTMCHIIAGIDE